MNNDQDDVAEIRSRWRIRWLTSIAEFADYDLQRRSWFGGSRYDSPYWSFGEWMCRYFDDLALFSGYGQCIERGLVNHKEAEAVSAFHAAAAAYKAPGGDGYDHDAVLADPAWREVISLADSARLRLFDISSDPSERRVLER